jgi:3-oxoacyl-[acyl-carrier protein] reductase/meso-butanediol dehydrogenase/(S,S)-butanediol dehydrogenase/diacetyl reductase
MNSLESKVALVTGAGSIRGMGRAVAQRLSREGADVVVVDREMAPKSIWPGEETWRGLEAVVEEIEAAGRKGMAFVADISNSKDVNDTVAKTLGKFGKIDILVHCAAIRGPVGPTIVELNEEIWRRVIDVNLTGSFLICKAVARTMIPNPEGKKIVIIASVAGTFGAPGSSSYCASKYGVIGLAKTLALELAQYKINVNAINPDTISTNLVDERIVAAAKAQGISVAELLQKRAKEPQPGPKIPLGRHGEPHEVADLVYFLVSEQSSYITGETINIDGGAH